MKYVRNLISVFISFCLVFVPIATDLSMAQSQLSVQNVSCDVSSEDKFKEQLETIIQNVMRHSLGDLKYNKIIASSWKQHDVDGIINKLVDDGVENIKKSKTTVELLQTLGSTTARESLAKDLAEYVYDSEKFKNGLEKVAVDVGQAVSVRIDAITTQAANPITQCIQKFVGPQYGDTIALYVTQQTRDEIIVDPNLSKSETGITDIVREASGGLTGGLLIVLRRAILQRVSRWVGKRLIGSLVTRAIGAAISVVAWILVAKEVWDLRNGVLPILAKEMKSKSAKERVQSELVRELDTEITKVLDGIPKDISAGIYNVWVKFKEDNRKTLALVQKFPKFKTLLENLHVQDERLSLSRLRKTNQLVQLSLDIGGETYFQELLDNGELKKGISGLSETGVKIAVDTRSMDTAFQWQSLAKDFLDRVVKLEIHKFNSPESYSTTSLEKLLSLKNDEDIRDIVSLSAQERQIIFQLPQDYFQEFGKSFAAKELLALSYYIDVLKPDVSQRFLLGIRNNPEKMRLLAQPYVQNGVLRSQDQGAALDLMLRKRALIEIVDLPDDIQLVTNGQVSPVLLWVKQPLAIIVSSLLCIFILLIFLRLVFRRRKKVA